MFDNIYLTRQKIIFKYIFYLLMMRNSNTHCVYEVAAYFRCKTFLRFQMDIKTIIYMYKFHMYFAIVSSISAGWTISIRVYHVLKTVPIG